MNQKPDKKGEITTQIQYRLIEEIAARKQAEETLRESEERFRSLYENSTIGLYRTTPDGRILLANPALVQMLGYSSFEELSSRNLEKEGFEIGYSRSEFIKRVEREGKVIGFESAWRKRDGSAIFIRESAKVIQADDGSILYYEGTVEDITERKRAEAMVRESEERFRTIFESEPECVKLLDENGTVLRMNPAGLKMVDANTSDQVEGKSVYPLLSPEYRSAFKAFNEKILQGESGIMEFEIVGLKGNRRILESHAVPIRNIEGEVTTILSVTRDITERRQAEEALRESETLFRTSFESAVSGSALVNEEGRIIQTNRSIENMLGYTRDELQNMTIVELTFPDDVDENLRLLNEMLEGKRDSYRMEIRYCRKDGSVIWGDLLVSAIRDKNGVFQYCFATVVNITERKQVEEALRRSKSNLEAAQRIANIGSWEWDVLADTALWSDETYRMFGMEPRELEEHRQDFLDRVHTDDRPRVDQALSDALCGTKEYNLEYRIVLPDKIEKVIHARAEVIRNNDGKAVLLRGTVHDITERKRAEEALQESEVKFRTLFEDSRDAIYVSSKEGSLVDFNQSMEEMLGYSREELLTLSVVELYTNKDDRLQLQQLIESQGYVKDYEVCLRKKDSTVIDCLVTASVRKDPSGEIIGYQGIFRDITERRQAEEEVKEKMQQLDRTNKLMVGRELKMIELKKEINTLLEKAGQPKKYTAPDEVK